MSMSLFVFGRNAWECEVARKIISDSANWPTVSWTEASTSEATDGTMRWTKVMEVPSDASTFRAGIEQVWALKVAAKLDDVRAGLGADFDFQQSRGRIWTITVVLSERMWFTAATMTAVENLSDQQEGAQTRVRTRVEFQGKDGCSYSAVYSSLHAPDVLRGISRPTELDHRLHRLVVEPTGRVLKVEYRTENGEWYERDIE